MLDTCRELGITVVAFSPLARGFLTGRLRDMSVFPPKDIRHQMPRFQPAHFAANLRLLDGLAAIAGRQGCTDGQIAMAWVLARGEHIVPIPGTTRLDHLEENAGAADVRLDDATMRELDALINPATVSGAALQRGRAARYRHRGTAGARKVPQRFSSARAPLRMLTSP